VTAAYDGVHARPGTGLPDAQAVADVLGAAGCSTEVEVVAQLHDVVEDGAQTVDDVRAAFPDDIAAKVLALTEDSTIDDYHRRKAALRRQLAESVLPA
jgi:(p)ppGpp synthase/HD superfamily hydrolase